MGTKTVALDTCSGEPSLPEMQVVLQGTSPKGNWSIRRGTFQSGLSAGVEVIELQHGQLSVYVVPTRGMGIWKAKLNDIEVGWKSPVPKLVNPAFVNLHSRNGLGWLDGFNELVCRCGLSSNGPPGTDEKARSPIESSLTLHGKIANIPARDVEVFADESTGEVGVTGYVDERTVFGPQLVLKATIRLSENGFVLRDEIINEGASDAEVALLYHINIGKPFLEEGSQVVCPSRTIVPRNGHAAQGIDSHDVYEGPTAGFAEQVYFHDLLANDQNQTLALLKNRSADKGISLRYSREQLPAFSVWKCTQDEVSGYVTGLEPGINFPNFRPFEREQGRLVQLPAGETYLSEIAFGIHTDAEQVASVCTEIQAIQGDQQPKVEPRPVLPFCVDD